MPDEPNDRRRWGFGIPFAVVAILIAIGAVVFWVRTDEAPAEEDASTIEPVLASSNSFLECGECHGDMDRVFLRGELPNLLFTHEKHFEFVSDCAACHPANTHVQDQTNVPRMSMCFMCHGVEEGSAAPGRCSLCHPKNMPMTPQTHLTGSWLPNEHGEAALADRIECLACHEQKTFCDSCHGLRMPHPRNWDEGNHEGLFFEDQDACQQCHVRVSGQRDFCDTCHHPRGSKDEGWLTAHPVAVTNSGAFTCFECHSPQTCSSCHIDGEETYEADEQLHRETPTPSPRSGSA
jgi:hypothetical protein